MIQALNVVKFYVLECTIRPWLSGFDKLALAQGGHALDGRLLFFTDSTPGV